MAGTKSQKKIQAWKRERKRGVSLENRHPLCRVVSPTRAVSERTWLMELISSSWSRGGGGAGVVSRTRQRFSYDGVNTSHRSRGILVWGNRGEQRQDGGNWSPVVNRQVQVTSFQGSWEGKPVAQVTTSKCGRSQDSSLCFQSSLHPALNYPLLLPIADSHSFPSGHPQASLLSHFHQQEPLWDLDTEGTLLLIAYGTDGSLTLIPHLKSGENRSPCFGEH